MKEFIEHLIKGIVKNPDQVAVEEVNEDGQFNYTIDAAEDDIAIIIGKHGNNINAIRNLAKAKAIIDNVRINVQISKKYD